MAKRGRVAAKRGNLWAGLVMGLVFAILGVLLLGAGPDWRVTATVFAVGGGLVAALNVAALIWRFDVPPPHLAADPGDGGDDADPSDPVTRIAELKRLHDEGQISEDDYQARRDRLVRDL